MAKPSKRTDDLEAKVLERLSSGEPLVWICNDLGIHYTTWREWCRADESLDIAHKAARDHGYDAIAARLRETSRGRGDSTQDVQRDKLIIETDFKLLAKWDPRRYGDKLEIDATVKADVKVTIGGDA